VATWWREYLFDYYELESPQKGPDLDRKADTMWNVQAMTCRRRDPSTGIALRRNNMLSVILPSA